VTKAFTGGFRIRDRTLINPAGEIGTTDSSRTLAESEVGEVNDEVESRDVFTTEQQSHLGKKEEGDNEEKRISRALSGINSRYIEFTKRLFRSHSTNSLSEKASSSDAHVSASCQGSSARGSSSAADSQKFLRKSQSSASLSSTSYTNRSTNIRLVQEEAEVVSPISGSEVVDDIDFKEGMAEAGTSDQFASDQIVGYPETPDIKKYLHKVSECFIKVTHTMENPDFVPRPAGDTHDASTARKTVSFDDHPEEHLQSDTEEGGNDLHAFTESPPNEKAEEIETIEDNNEDSDQDIPSVNATLIDITNKYLNITAFLLDPVTSEDAESLDEVSKASTVIENKTSSLSKDEDDVISQEPVIVVENVPVCGMDNNEEDDSEVVPDIKTELVKFATEFIKINQLLGKLFLILIMLNIYIQYVIHYVIQNP